MPELTITDIGWEDILFPNVLKQLSIRDLFNLRCCSSNLKKLVDEFFIKNIRSINSENFRTQSTIMVLLQQCERVTELILCNLDWLTDEILLPFLEKNINIQHLDISTCSNLTDKCLFPMVFEYKALYSLHLINCYWITEGMLECLMQNQTGLKFFILRGLLTISDQCLYKLANTYNARISFDKSNMVFIETATLNHKI